MSVARVNGVGLYYELTGSGEPLVLVHGSWSDHHNWDRVVGPLAESFCVLTYDRRGHSASERPPDQGSVFEDADDLAALIETLELDPAHIVGNSGGASIILRAASSHAEIFRTLIAHEPPLFSLLAGTEFAPELEKVNKAIGAIVELLESGDHEAAARQFTDTIALGPDAWSTQLTRKMRATFITNAPTFLDEARDPEFTEMDFHALASFNKPALLSSGTASSPIFGQVVDMVAARIPGAERVTIESADHVPHISLPDRYVRLISTFIRNDPLAKPRT